MAEPKPLWQRIDHNSATWVAISEWLSHEEAVALETAGTPGLGMVETEVARARRSVCRELLDAVKLPEPVIDKGNPYGFDGPRL